MIISFINPISINDLLTICKLNSHFRKYFFTIYISNDAFSQFFVDKMLSHHNFFLIYISGIIVHYILNK